MNAASIVIITIIILAVGFAAYHILTNRGKADKCSGCSLKKFCG